MTIILPTDKIKGRHRDRLAIVYIRQSTLQQVGHNQEFDTPAVRAGRPGPTVRLGTGAHRRDR